MRGRKPKHFDLAERLERYADAIELEPAKLAGRWAEACAPSIGAEDPGTGGTEPARFGEVRLDLGCGKGAFLVEAARREPDVLFVGVDFEPVCIAYAAQAICESGLDNCVVAPGRGDEVPSFFAPGEVSLIYLNFPTPYPRKRDAGLRLVALERLLDYRGVLSDGGKVWLRTDSQPLRDFCRGQLALAGYRIVLDLDDERAAGIDVPSTYYEERLVAKGAKVLSLAAVPEGTTPEHVRQTEPLSLVDYLPEDLDDLDYLPYGMEWTVETIRRRRKGRIASDGRPGRV